MKTKRIACPYCDETLGFTNPDKIEDSILVTELLKILVFEDMDNG